MHDADVVWSLPFRAQYLNRVRFSFASMNNHRQPDLARQTQLASKDFLLNRARRIVVVIIQTNLAKSLHLAAAHQQLRETFFCLIVEEPRIMRVSANGGVNIFVSLCQLNSAVESVTVRISGADIEQQIDAGGVRSLNYFLAIVVVLRPINVAMRV